MYRITRFYAPGSGKSDHTVRTVYTLEEAQAHCQDEATHGVDWFDGYTEV